MGNYSDNGEKKLNKKSPPLSHKALEFPKEFHNCVHLKVSLFCTAFYTSHCENLETKPSHVCPNPVCNTDS